MIRKVLLIVFFALVGFNSDAYAQARSCVDEFLKNKPDEPDLGSVNAEEVQAVVEGIAMSIGITRTVKAIPCSFVSKVQSFYLISRDTGSSDMEYIIYDPTWVREVIGKDKTELTALIGHELGHVLNGDFTVRKAIPRKQKEVDADRLGGCAVGRINGSWKKLEGLFSRIRTSASDDYPSREESLVAARGGFLTCGGRLKPVCRISQNGVESWGVEKNETGTSSWMKGGHSQPEYCANLRQALQVLYGSDFNFHHVTSSETTRDSCKPFNCIEYQYACTMQVRGNPIYKEAESDACLDVN